MKERLTNFVKFTIGSLTVLLFAAILVIAYTGNGSTYFAFLKYVPGGDKTGHALLMCVLSVVLSWLFDFRGLKLKGMPLPYGVLCVFAFITAEEFLQTFSANRTFDLFDLAANYVGIALALVVVHAILRMRLRSTTTPI